MKISNIKISDWPCLNHQRQPRIINSVVNVFTLNDTVPKSDKHSIDTKANPAIIAGLAEAKLF